MTASGTNTNTSANQHPDTIEGAAPLSPLNAAVYGAVCANNALYSRFIQRLHRRYPQELLLLPAGLPDLAMLQATHAALVTQGHEPSAALRILRQLVLERLAVLDCDGAAAMHHITSAMTHLAEFALDLACTHAFAQLDERHGAPLKPDGSRVNFWVVGMGKLGARELNVSSDIDLIYVYETDGETAGAAPISFQEYFARAVKRIYAFIGETTEHGFVFRVDLALRPNGNSGPSVSSLQALAEYLQVQGREWERFAWLKSRVVAPVASIANHSARQLRHVVLPFVFRRYLDFNVYEALRQLHDQIRAHAASRSAGHPERANDVKISRGGIREIEFTVQLLQVVRGGQYPELRVRPTVDALAQLARSGLMSSQTATALAQAYIFLRQVEHRIQYLDDQQTHILPTNPDDLQWLAHTMRHPSTESFMQALAQHRELVAHEFDLLLSRNQPATSSPDASTASSTSATSATSAAPQATASATPANTSAPASSPSSLARAPAAPLHTPATSTPEEDDDIAHLQTLLPASHTALAQRLQTWRSHTRIATLRPSARQKLMRLMQRSLHWLPASPSGSANTTNNNPNINDITEAGLLRFIDWLETLLRRESYLAMLLEHPLVHERLLQLLGVARWPARYLTSNPGVIDELSSNTMFEGRFERDTFTAKLTQRLHALQATGEDDEETLLNLLRRAMHASTFRTLARDLDGRLSVEQVGDDLSGLADAILHLATHWCWQRLLPKVHSMGFTNAPQDNLDEHFAIVAYGKLGGLELGYGSDLDLVFIYENTHERSGEIYAMLVRKLITWLTSKTSEGDLYEIDTALRPNGNSGLLTTTIEAYESYQLQRGSNTAWLWEHQAMTRARCCFGSPRLRTRFDAIRSAVITAQRDAASLKQEIIAMRQRVSSAHKVADGQFNLKHSAGGMIDAEFITQYLVLLHSHQHPTMLENRGNIALLERADTLGILPEGKNLGHAAASAYRTLRHRQHRARLNEESMLCEPANVQAQAQAIKALWQHVLG